MAGPAAFSIGAAVLWVVLALNNPTLTYHFAPLIVAGAWGIAMSPTTRTHALTAAAGGLALALAATAVIAGQDALRGPDFFDGDHALIETLVFAALGAAIALVVGRGRVAAQATTTAG